MTENEFEAGLLGRDEHLEECKKRALTHFEAANYDEALSSMMKDLIKHEETKNHAGLKIGLSMLMSGMKDPAFLKRWIAGFR